MMKTFAFDLVRLSRINQLVSLTKNTVRVRNQKIVSLTQLFRNQFDNFKYAVQRVLGVSKHTYTV